jgi:rhomboid-like protein
MLWSKIKGPAIFTAATLGTCYAISSQSSGQKYSKQTRQVVLGSLIAANGLVFAAWQLPRCHSFLTRHFVHHPGGRLSYTLLTSCFSHQTPAHLFFNMAALYSVGSMFLNTGHLSPVELVAMYISSGTAAGFISHTVSWSIKRVATGSLGASGAIWGLFAGWAALYPQWPISIMFLPISFQAGQLLPALLCLDLVGLIRGWAYFDHAAHLGGAMFGYLTLRHK